MAVHKLLECYPFKNKHVELIEGYSAYDGNLGDAVGGAHKGIDYVLRRDGGFFPFEVFAMHAGAAWQGISPTWGRFVIIYADPGGGLYRYETIYAHLDEIDPRLPLLKPKQEPDPHAPRVLVRAGDRLGLAGTSGETHGHVQLHLEFHQKNLQTQTRQKLDPYGIYDRFSSGKYPQPGQSLNQWDHAWINDEPTLAGRLV